MATIKVFDATGVRELHCFDNLALVPYFDDEEEEQIIDDGELTIGTPLE